MQQNRKETRGIPAKKLSFAFGLVLVLLTTAQCPAQSTCAPGWQGTTLIDAESLANWTIEQDTGSSGRLSLVPGLIGRAVQLDWDTGSGDWVQGRYDFPAPVDLSQADIFGVRKILRKARALQ